MALTLSKQADEAWRWLISAGCTEAGTAGLMGNLYAESRLNPTCVEELLLRRYRDEGYKSWSAAAYDQANYDRYTAAVDSGDISEAEFLSPRLYTGQTHQYGYGLAQWTTDGRKGGLYDYIKSKNASISDLKCQCEYLYSELQNSLKSTLNVLKTASDINTASDYVLLHFEQPRDAESQIGLRRKYSNEIYNLLGGGMVIIGGARIDENGYASGGIRRTLVKLG